MLRSSLCRSAVTLLLRYKRIMEMESPKLDLMITPRKRPNNPVLTAAGHSPRVSDGLHARTTHQELLSHHLGTCPLRRRFADEITGLSWLQPGKFDEGFHHELPMRG